MSSKEEDKDKIIAQLREENRLLREKNTILEKKINALINKIFGSNSEKLDPAQLELLLHPEDAKKPDAAECEEDAPAAELEHELRVVKPPKTREPRVPKNIRKVEEIITPEHVLKNPEQYRKIGEKRTT